MTYAAFFETVDGFVAVADGWTQYDKRLDDYSSQKLVSFSLPGGTDVVCAYAGRASTDGRTVGQILCDEALPSRWDVAAVSLGTYARRIACVLGDMAEQNDHKSARALSLLVGFGGEPAWYDVEVTAGGLCIKCTPGLPGQQSIGGRADEIEPELLAVLGGRDTTQLTGKHLSSLIRLQLLRMWRSNSTRFKDWGVGGMFRIITVTDGEQHETRFVLNSN